MVLHFDMCAFSSAAVTCQPERHAKGRQPLFGVRVLWYLCLTSTGGGKIRNENHPAFLLQNPYSSPQPCWKVK